MANETILIVDADAKSQKVLEVSFKKAGYRVVMTDDPEEVPALLEETSPDIVISDTQFPEGDGFALLEELQEDDDTSALPFIFLTEERSLPRKMKGFELGADDYLTKPVYIKEVTTRVELLLQKRAKEMLSEEAVEKVEGHLADITMIDLLQTIEEELRSGSITLRRNNKQAVVYFRQGNILDAICGKLQGEEAIYRLMLWPDGDFAVRYHEDVRRTDRIEKDSGALLMEGINRLEQWNELTADLPPLNRVFEADYQRLPALLPELPREVGRVVRLFDGVRTIRDVIDDSPVDDVTTLQIARKLIGDDILRDVGPGTDKESAGSRSGERSNLAAWLEEVRSDAADISTEIGKEDTSPKFGSINGLTEPRGDERDTDQLESPAGRETRRDGAWKFHFGDEEAPEEAIKEIEADERRRREEEAKQLADTKEPHREGTLQFAPAVERDTGEVASPSKTEAPSAEVDRELAEAERRRREEEARRLEQQKRQLHPEAEADHEEAAEDETEEVSADEEGRQRRETEEVPAQQAPTPEDDRRTERQQQPGRRSSDDTGELFVDDIVAAENEERRRQRTATPISTPAQSMSEASTAGEEQDEADVPVADEASTAEIQAAEHAAASSEERRAVAIEEAESVKREAAASVRESAQHAAVTAADAADAADAEAHRLGDEVSESDAFEDEEPEGEETPEEEAEAADETPAEAEEEEEPAEIDAGGDEEALPATERETRELDAASSPALTPLGEEVSEPVVGEDDVSLFEEVIEETAEEVVPAGVETGLDEDTAPGDVLEEVDLEPLEGLPPVERQSRDGEVVTAEYDLSGSGRASHVEEESPGGLRSEAETLDLDREDLKKAEEEEVAAGAAAAPPAEEEAALEETIEPEADTPTHATHDDEEDAEGHGAITSTEMEESFFSDRDADDYEYYGEPEPRNWVLPVLGIVAVAIIMIALVLPSMGDDDAPPKQDEVATNDEPDEPVEEPGDRPVDEPAEKPPEPVGLTGGEARQFASAQGSDVSAEATELTRVLSGNVLPPDGDAGGVPDAGATGQLAAANGTDEPPKQPGQDTPPAEEPVEKPPVEEPVEKPVEKPDPKPSGGGVNAQIRRAERMINRERYGDALKLLRDLSDKAPSNGKVAYLRGRAAFSANRTSEAITQFNRALNNGFRSADLYIDLGAAHQLDGNRPEAKKAYQKFLELRPSGKQADEIRTILNTQF